MEAARIVANSIYEFEVYVVSASEHLLQAQALLCAAVPMQTRVLPKPLRVPRCLNMLNRAPRTSKAQHDTCAHKQHTEHTLKSEALLRMPYIVEPLSRGARSRTPSDRTPKPPRTGRLISSVEKLCRLIVGDLLIVES